MANGTWWVFEGLDKIIKWILGLVNDKLAHQSLKDVVDLIILEVLLDILLVLNFLNLVHYHSTFSYSMSFTLC